ncbi:hypothetical protein Scep_015739 [Stephania cephalantha]|uniref:Cytochrome P450 n=1 Tax=Stephania cephalantha TaxID=152367 RepID=A0AAP0P1K2_9MAGN
MHLIRSIPHKSFRDLCDRYGPLIYLRLGSVPCVVASSPELAREIVGHNELYFASRSITVASHHITYDSSGFAFVPYTPFWKFAKKIVMSQLLGGRTLSQLQPIRADELRLLVELLLEKAKAEETVNLSEEFMKFSNNVISRMTLSIRYSGKDDQARVARDLAREVTEIFGAFNLSDYIWFLKNIDVQGLLKRSKVTRSKFDDLLEKILKERQEIRMKKKTSDQDSIDDGVKDFVDILLDIQEDESQEIKLTRNNIKAIALDLFMAGTDTSASASEWALAELYNHPAIFNKAREEIDSVVGKTRLIQESDVPNLPYLQAIMKETLRLHPPIPFLARESTEDRNISGYDIPAKTAVFINVWSINRDPKYWPDPWSSSQRGCPGIWLALQEVPAVVGAMIQCFDWKMKDKAELDMSERPGLTVPRAVPLVLVPVTRLNPFG